MFVGQHNGTGTGGVGGGGGGGVGGGAEDEAMTMPVTDAAFKVMLPVNGSFCGETVSKGNGPPCEGPFIPSKSKLCAVYTWEEAAAKV